MKVQLRALPVAVGLSAAAACGGPPSPNATPVDPPVAEAPYVFEIPAALPASTTLLEAETAQTTGSVSEFSTTLHTAGAEASARRYVSLAPGQSVAFRTSVAADSVVVRFSYPDSADGTGRDGALQVQVNSSPVASLPVTSRYTWEYGEPAWGTKNVWSTDPGHGSPRHFWDEASLRLPSAVVAGASLTLLNPADAGQDVLIDFIELESIPPPVEAPAGSLSFADFEPAADGATDDTEKLTRALVHAAKQQRALYVPEGTYLIGSVEMATGTLQGAGLWRTRFVGPKAQIRFMGGPVRVADLAIFGQTTKRNDQGDEGNAFAGRPGEGSSLERIWVEHMKCAFWVSNAGQERGPNGLRITGCRFRDLMADAVNLCNGTTQSTLDNNQIRNTGDDGLAAWSPARTPAGGHNTFAHNSIQSPWVASGIALYGGGPFRVVGNTVKDTVTTGSGIYVSAFFGAHAFHGRVEVSDNLLVRSGAHESDPGGPTGAFRLMAGDLDMTHAEFLFRNNTVVAPLESAVSIQGPRRITGVRFDGLVVQDAPWVVDVRPSARGAAVFTAVTADPTEAGFRDASAGLFDLTR